jgi:hypothetical protein
MQAAVKGGLRFLKGRMLNARSSKKVAAAYFGSALIWQGTARCAVRARKSLSENSHGIGSSSSSSSSSFSKNLPNLPNLTMKMSMRMRMKSQIPIFQTRSKAGRQIRTMPRLHAV